MTDKPNDEFFKCDICDQHAMQVGLEVDGATLCIMDADIGHNAYIRLSLEDCRRLAEHLMRVLEQT